MTDQVNIHCTFCFALKHGYAVKHIMFYGMTVEVSAAKAIKVLYRAKLKRAKGPSAKQGSKGNTYV
jgi:hypothetical protein